MGYLDSVFGCGVSSEAGGEERMNKKIHISIVVEENGTHTSFYFKGATVSHLSMLNHELDILKGEIIDRIKEAPKDYEIEDYGEEEK